MARRSVLALAVACAVVMVAGCSHQFLDIGGPQYVNATKDGGYTIFFAPDTRARNTGDFFRKEYELVNATMDASLARALGDCKETVCRPKALIGLGLSGGGLRSNAFQLGLLSALHEANATHFSKDEKELRSTALDNIAYLSSVSGGTWAAAGMMSYRAQTGELNDREAFFAELNNTVVNDRRLARCATGFVTKRDDCPDNATRILNNSYEPVTDRMDKVPWLANPFTMTAGYTAREAWRELLLGTHLLGMDRGVDDMVPDLSKRPAADRASEPPLPDRGPGYAKPFWIINATHSASTSGNNPYHFNFQITPLGVSTMADCGNTRYFGFKGSYTGFYKPFDRQGSAESFPSLSVSHAMAMSGAVFPERILGFKTNMFEWDLPMPKPDSEMLRKVKSVTGSEADPIRGKYTLADGGHSENFGALALMERGADLLVISDAGYDEKYTFSDYNDLKHHARELLKIAFKVDAKVEYQQAVSAGQAQSNAPSYWNGTSSNALSPAHAPDTEVPEAIRQDLAVYFESVTENDNSTLNAMAYLGHYCFAPKPDASGQEKPCPPGERRQVIYLRPPYSLGGFKKHLLEKDNRLILAENPTWSAEADGVREKIRRLKAVVSAQQARSCLRESIALDPQDPKLEVPERPHPFDLITKRIPGSADSSWVEQTRRDTLAELVAIANALDPKDTMAQEMNNATIRDKLAGIRYGDAPLQSKFDTCNASRSQEHQNASQGLKEARERMSELYRISKQKRANKPDTGYLATYHYLNLNRTEFPRDKTFVSSYDRELIFAYFLLGKYMGEEKLVPLLKEYLEAKVPR